jgi:hypothetical protein
MGITVWFTGLSGSGKTTLARALGAELVARGHDVEILDGDENIRRIGSVAGLLTRHGVVVLAAAISPYREMRDEVRGRIGSFLEVYVNAPLQVCEQRVDLKGYDTEIVTEQAIEFMRGAKKGQPFCLWIGYKACHAPFTPAPGYEKYLADVEIKPPASYFIDDPGKPRRVREKARGRDTRLQVRAAKKGRQVVPSAAPLSLEQWTERERNQYRCLMGVEDSVRRLFSFLAEHNAAWPPPNHPASGRCGQSGRAGGIDDCCVWRRGTLKSSIVNVSIVNWPATSKVAHTRNISEPRRNGASVVQTGRGHHHRLLRR